MCDIEIDGIRDGIIAVSYTHLVHGLHFWGVLGRVGGGQEHAAFRDFADFAVDGGEEVALVRCRMLPEAVSYTHLDVYKRQRSFLGPAR